jgi:hypothetical protein
MSWKIVASLGTLAGEVKKTTRRIAKRHVAGSAAGLAFGAGYVVQKWRPHVGQTQNWSGVHGRSGAGSRISI